MCVLSHSVVPVFLQPHKLQPTRLLRPWNFSRQEYWSKLPFPPPGRSFPYRDWTCVSYIYMLHLLHWQADSLPLSHLGSPQPTPGAKESRDSRAARSVPFKTAQLGKASPRRGHWANTCERRGHMCGKEHPQQCNRKSLKSGSPEVTMARSLGWNEQESNRWGQKVN